jgi:hypothetical protein
MTKRRRLTVSTVTSIFLRAKSCTVMKIWNLFVANSMKFWKKMHRNWKFCKIFKNFLISIYCSRLVQEAQNVYGCLNFSFPYFVNSQMWLNQLMDEYHLEQLYHKIEKKNADNNLSILICSIIMVYLIIRDQNVYIKRIFFRTALICFLFQDLIEQCVTS